MSEPIYEEDLVNLGYLKKILDNISEEISLPENISKHYSSRPQPPYYQGDTWINGTKIYTCINTRLIGLYDPSDWVSESGAKLEAESKNKTYLTKPSNYKRGDKWLLQSDTDHKAGLKGELLITTATRSDYNEDDWVNIEGYGRIASINELARNIYSALQRIGLTSSSINDNIVKVYYQNTVPTANENDLWYCTDNVDSYVEENLYRYNGTNWIQIEDKSIRGIFKEANEARLVSDGKIQIFYLETKPIEDIEVGDLWIETTNNNKLHRYNGTNWVDVYDTRVESIENDLDEVKTTVVNISTDLGQIDESVKEIYGDVATAISSHTISIRQINQQVTEIKELTETISGTDMLHITKAMATDAGVFKIKGNEYFVYLVPSEMLVPSETLVPMGDGITICVDSADRNNPSDDYKEYFIPISDPLRYINNIYDELVISRDDNIAKIIRRIGLDENNVPYILGTEVTEEIVTEIHLKLNEGDNYIYVKELRGLEYEITYALLNNFTNTFATHAELNSRILESSTSILAEVNTKIDEKDIIAKINLAVQNEQGVINLVGNVITIESDKFKLSQDGTVSVFGSSFNILGDNKNLLANFADNGLRLYSPDNIKEIGGLVRYLGQNDYGLGLTLYKGESIALMKTSDDGTKFYSFIQMGSIDEVPYIRNTADGTLFPEVGEGITVKNGLITKWSLSGATGKLSLMDSSGNGTVTVTVKNGLITEWVVS